MFSPFEESIITSIYQLYDLFIAFNVIAYSSSGFYIEQSALLYICNEVHLLYASTWLELFELYSCVVIFSPMQFHINVPYDAFLNFPFVLFDIDLSGLYWKQFVSIFFYNIIGQLDILQQFWYLHLFVNMTDINIMFMWISFTWLFCFNIAGRDTVYVFNKIVYFVYNDMLIQYVGEAGKKYFVFFIYMFIFILIGNIVGLVPNIFSVTSNLAVTLFLSSVSWLGILFVGLSMHGIRFFLLFYPAHVPYVLVPLLMLIELVSYIVRVISLALRLFANIVAGHILLDILSLFFYYVVASVTVSFSYYAVLCGVLLLCMLVGMLVFELFIALVQAYIFIVMSMIYLREVIYIHADE